MSDESPCLFAELSIDSGVMTCCLVGPNIGPHEGEVIASLVRTRIHEGDRIKYVVLDFGDVQYINSGGIGACVQIYHDALETDTVVVLHALRKDLREIFKLTRIDKIFVMTTNDHQLASFLRKG